MSFNLYGCLLKIKWKINEVGVCRCLIRVNSLTRYCPMLLIYLSIFGSACSPFLKSLFSLPFFCFTAFLRYFRQFSHSHITHSCPNLAHQPSLHIINGFKQISKWWFYQFSCSFLLKINFWAFEFLKQTYQVISLSKPIRLYP